MVAALISISLLRSGYTISGRVTQANGRPAVQAIVWFTGSVRPKPLGKAMVDQRDRSFIPHVSVVPVGTKVEFPNNDTIFHNVFTEFNSTKFDFGNYPKGTSKSKVFDKPGLAVLMCSIHPDMGAYIMVVDTPYYALTDKKGEYRIANVAAGHYKVEVWHESGAKATLETNISDTTTLPLSLHK